MARRVGEQPPKVNFLGTPAADNPVVGGAPAGGPGRTGVFIDAQGHKSTFVSVIPNGPWDKFMPSGSSGPKGRADR